jgi:predicted transcriptional regulator
MPFQISHLVENHAAPICIGPGVPAADALDIMIWRDFSQLPVVDSNNRLLGIITAESVLHSVRQFALLPEKLSVADCQTRVDHFTRDADLFAVLSALESSSAVVIVDDRKVVVAIITDYDSAEFFRQRAEAAMLV